MSNRIVNPGGHHHQQGNPDRLQNLKSRRDFMIDPSGYHNPPSVSANADLNGDKS